MRHRRILWPAGRIVVATCLVCGILLVSRTHVSAADTAVGGPSAWRSSFSRIYLPALSLRSPLETSVTLLARSNDTDGRAHFRIADKGPRKTSMVGATEFPPRALGMQPLVTITTPGDRDTVRAGIIRVCGTVQPNVGRAHVMVNGVSAIVRGDSFTAAVRVTPYTMLLTAVATATGTTSTRHQIALTVTESPQSRRGLSVSGAIAVPPLKSRFRLPLGSAPTALYASAAGGSSPHAIAARWGGKGLAALPLSTAVEVEARARFGNVLGPLVLDAPAPAAEDPQFEPPEWTATASQPNAGREERVDLAPAAPGILPRMVARLVSLRLFQDQDDDVPQGLRRVRLGSQFSLGLLFTRDGRGMWRISWF